MCLPLIQMNSRAAARDENVDRACQFVAEERRRFPLFRDHRPDAYDAINRASEDLDK